MLDKVRLSSEVNASCARCKSDQGEHLTTDAMPDRLVDRDELTDGQAAKPAAVSLDALAWSESSTPRGRLSRRWLDLP